MTPWSIVCAANNEEILRSCLLSSPDVEHAADLQVQRGFHSAAAAYNDGLQQATGEVVVLLHQDVYLPPGWLKDFQRTLDLLSRTDPNWGVLGVWGVPVPTNREGVRPRPGVWDFKRGARAGYLYWTGLTGVAGQPFDGVAEVTTLDELLLVVRRSSGLRFDEGLEGYHMYGTDICLEARRRGMKCYAISAFCIHNTSEYTVLPLAFWRAYFYLRKKWISELPISTPCTDITRWCWPVVKSILVRTSNLLQRNIKPRCRAVDPLEIYQDLLRTGLLPQPQVPASHIGSC